jgi:hypothetical protein
VTRRILRHHKKIFKDDIEKLCKFIVASCEALSCLLSSRFRVEKNKRDVDAKENDSNLKPSEENIEDLAM